MKKIQIAGFLLMGMILSSLLYAATINGWIDIPESAVTNNPASGWQRLYATADKLYRRNSSGTVTEIGAHWPIEVGAYEVGTEDASATLTTADLTNHAFLINDANAKTLTEASCVSDAGSQAVTVKTGSTSLFTITCVAPGSYSRSTTDGTSGYILASSMSSTAVSAGALLDLSGAANATTKDIKLHLYGTVN
jgi:hypothetical protein